MILLPSDSKNRIQIPLFSSLASLVNSKMLFASLTILVKRLSQVSLCTWNQPPFPVVLSDF